MAPDVAAGPGSVAARVQWAPRWILVVRAVIGLFAVLLAVLQSAWVREGQSLWPATLVGIWVVTSTLLTYVIQTPRWRRTVFRLVLFGDTLAAAAVVQTSGSVHSPTLLLLALPVLACGLIFLWRYGLIAGLITAILYGAMALAGSEHPIRAPELWMRIGFHAFFFTSMGLVAGWLSKRTTSSLQEAAETRVALEEIRLSTDRIVESMSCGLIAVDSRRRIRSVNREARRLLGLAANGPAAAPDIVEDNGPIDKALRSALDADPRPSDCECTLTSSAGERFPAWLKVTPVVDQSGDSKGAVALFWDLTERKQLEQEAREKARLALVGELSAGLAHEMRNSLKPISGSVELLQTGGLLPPAAEPVLELISREADSLEAFLSQFLALARDKTLKLETIHLEDFIRQEAVALRVGSSSGGETVDVPRGRGICVRGDRDWLRQVFRNLLLNSIEAAPGRRVEVEITPLCRAGRDWVRVRVKDEGPGLVGVDEREAFRPFRTTKPAGTGLGLSIAQRGVTEHGGRIGFEFRPGGGGCVVVDLPADGPPTDGQGLLRRETAA